MPCVRASCLPAPAHTRPELFYCSRPLGKSRVVAIQKPPKSSSVIHAPSNLSL